MSQFDTFVMVDWSGGNDRGRAPKADAIWACLARSGRAEVPVYLRNRTEAESWLTDCIEVELAAGRRLCLGFDFPFGYPAGFATALTGSEDPLGLWDWFEQRIEDSPKANNRFDLAGEINLRFGGTGPFWGNGLKRDIAGLCRNKAGYENPFAERRRVETLAKGSFTCWQLAGVGAVGSQVMMGLPVLSRLRRRFSDKVAVWPFQPLDRPVAFVEIWPSLTVHPAPGGMIKDAWQVEQVALNLSRLPADEFGRMLDVNAPEEGWILGIPHVRIDPPITPPARLRDDCFAMPRGVDWTPVDVALAHLKDNLSCVTGAETVAVDAALGRVLAADQIAPRANPPGANAAVDGYGFAHAGLGAGDVVLPLVEGRAAAGAPFSGIVPKGSTIRILTGALLPKGVDTVVLEEDVTLSGEHIGFAAGIKPGANARKAGEDVEAGAVAVEAGQVLRPPELALLSAVGIAEVPVHTRMRVGVLSTGDELAKPGSTPDRAATYDANRPMLLSVIDRWGYASVDLGHAPDDREALTEVLDAAADEVDVILTSGGASAGDEDHLSALLTDAGAMQMWRIAVKPGRPLALGLWQGVPVFGLPGNPVAALVCTLIFARPALSVLAGSGWRQAQGFMVPAAFEKRKKPGRREYLRARINADGQAEVFASEGSGRISGLSWADGLVELEDGARAIRPGDPVRYIPYGSFGL